MVQGSRLRRVGAAPHQRHSKSRGVDTKSKASLSRLHNLAYVENWTFCDATGVNTVMQTARNCAVLMVLSDGHLACWFSLLWDSWSGGPSWKGGEHPACVFRGESR